MSGGAVNTVACSQRVADHEGTQERLLSLSDFRAHQLTMCSSALTSRTQVKAL